MKMVNLHNIPPSKPTIESSPALGHGHILRDGFINLAYALLDVRIWGHDMGKS